MRTSMIVTILAGLSIAAPLSAGCNDTTAPPPKSVAQGTHEANVIVCAPGSYMSGSECIPVAAPTCPSGTVAQDGQCVAPPPPVTTSQPTKVAAAVDDEEALDTRAIHKTARARALLVTELQGLESLFQVAPKNAPDRPRLARRLAENYVELAYAAARDRAATTNPDDIAKAERIITAASSSALKYYLLLNNEYPKFCLNDNAGDPSKSTGCGDEPTYYGALESRRLGQSDEMAKMLLRLIQNYPQSKFVGQAYFLFGEKFRLAAASDPSKWMLAEQSYAEAAKYPDAPTAARARQRLHEARSKNKGNGGGGGF